ncbi:flagellar basal-body rod protein FlgF [Shewanella avicenniae]|uniref:Flagellar basal-body rod protein FlgF n=1 Tax=Shewanella avicenniae TaxID=2814294 RepID=A0ABX7QN00_9GAMM|nr:flagellar basal-body rod protein FlgF [Shewanella avicenniae]QSX32739.1 flagellar basal-body rod protein FlgF [Shewanella avicenniae]
MDKFLYISMTGAKQNMNALSVRANNLANASTDGFKADLNQARAMQAFGEGLPTRVFALSEKPASSFKNGPIQTTGRDMDIAIKGDGWIAVEDADGGEAYSRAGSLTFDSFGMVKNSHGDPVLGENGAPIILPLPIRKLDIGSDGMISVQPLGATPEVNFEVARIKLVNPGNENMMRGDDGLYRLMDGTTADANGDVSIVNGAIEGSNVNPIEEMTALINLQRQFELQVKMMKSAEENDKASASLLRIS